MVNWPIRRKLLVAPLAAVGAVVTSSLVEDRALLVLCCIGGSCASLIAAWFVATRLSRRIRALRDTLSHLLDRGGAALPPEETHTLDEIQALSNRLHRAIFRGRERETQMRRSSEFLEFAQAAGGFGVFDLDIVTGQVTGTPLFFDLLGLVNTAALFTRDEWFATLHPEDFEHVVRQLNDAITAAGTFRAEYRTLRQDGSIRWLAGRGQVLIDAEGLPARAIGTITDITDRKQLEDTLRYATESLNLAQAVAGVATMDLDFARKSWIVSDNFHQLLGIPDTTRLDDLNGHLSAVHADDFDRIRRAAHETTPQAPSYRCEYRVVLPDGVLRWISEIATVARDSQGDLCRITGALVDVTHLKLTEAALDGLVRQLGEKLRAVNTQLSRVS